MKIIAHRGACTEALENSWDAFRKAIECKATRIELDVHLTRDKHLAIIHDENLKRTAGINKLIVDLDRVEIEKEIRLSNGEKLPFLDEVFSELLPFIEINVEIKSFGPDTEKAAADLIRKQKFTQKIIVSTFSENTLKSLARDFSDIRLALLWDRRLFWPFAFQLGPKKFLKNNSIRIFHPEAHLVTPQIVQQIKLEGWEIYPYVGIKNEANKEELWAYLMTVGVDGLCTNYPREMKNWLEEALNDRKRFDQSPLVNRPV